jgi:hypothetical protein
MEPPLWEWSDAPLMENELENLSGGHIMSEPSDSDDISVPVWFTEGGMMVRRDALDPEHPQSTYSYIRDVLGKDPEVYGYYCSNDLTDEQKALLESLPDDVIFREARRREDRFVAREKYEGVGW